MSLSGLINYRSIIRESGFRSLGNSGIRKIYSWDPKSWVLESGIQFKE